MLKFVGTIVLLVGLILVVVGFILGQTSSVYTPYNVLGLFSPLTAFCVFGGAVASFFGFAMMMTGTPPGAAELKSNSH